MMNDLDAPFECAGLKLAVLNNLRELGIIDLGTPAEFASKVLGRPVDLEEEGYQLISECFETLRRYPLSPEQLEKVKTIYLSPTLEIVNYIFRFWDGEDDLMNVENLNGIEHCPNVQDFVDEDMLVHKDLSLIASHKKLTRFKAWTPYKNLDVFLGLPELRTLEIKKWPPSAEMSDVVAKLSARGVEVKL